MDILAKRIKRIEANLEAENAFIAQHLNLLRNQITPEILTVAIISSFILGYLLSRNKTPPQIFKSLLTMTHKGYRFYKKFKLFLP